MAEKDTPIKVGGAYVENEDHVPNLTDITQQYNTSGTGAHQQIEEIAPVFEVDKVKTAQEIKAALDDENTAVSSDKVLLPDPVGDNEAALKTLHKAADARLDRGVVVGGPGPAEREAALEGDEGVYAAQSQERANAASNSTGDVTAGQHTDAGGQPHGGSSSDGDKAPAKSASKGDWEDYAKKQGATDDELEGATKDDLVDKYGS